jgi:ubiquinone/menaquinone biosynthesis C-methylase UbiE
MSLDPYAAIQHADESLQHHLAQALELRAADRVQDEMLQSYLGELSLPQGARVLEGGSGTGAISRAISRLPSVSSVVGVDPSPVFTEKAKELSASLEGVRFDIGDGQDLQFADGEFDLVVLHTTLCHMPDPEKGLAEARRVLKAGGVLAIFDGDYVTATVATSESDPLQRALEVTIDNFVQHPWLSRRLPSLLAKMDMNIESFRSHGYTKTSEVSYFMSLLERGLDIMVGANTLGTDAAQALRDEALHREKTGKFFGHISYVSVISRTK